MTDSLTDYRFALQPNPTARLGVALRSRQFYPFGKIFAVVALAVIFSGCNSVKRKILVRTVPEGALVTIDRQPIGHSPVAVPYTYYGTREIQVELDGFVTQKVKHRFSAPWYQIPPLDFLTDNFLPREINDDRVVDFQLVPASNVDENLLRNRAEQLRGNVQRGTVALPLAHELPQTSLVQTPPQQTTRTAILPSTNNLNPQR